MKKYNVKVNLKGYWMEYTNVYFIDGIESYRAYMEILNNKFNVSESEIKNIKSFLGHGHSVLTGLSGMFCGMIDQKEKREPMLLSLKTLHATVLVNQLKDILGGNKLIINTIGGYLSIKPKQEYDIVETVNYNYTEKDIKTTKWWGGKHYYAKVGKTDVVDESGNVKWNTKKMAKEKAIKYMNKLNSLN